MKKHDSTWNEEKKSMILKNNSNAVEANKDLVGKICIILLNISSTFYLSTYCFLGCAAILAAAQPLKIVFVLLLLCCWPFHVLLEVF